ncbi:hypothetical protein, partial [Streptomyces sp. NPDC003857]
QESGICRQKISQAATTPCVGAATRADTHPPAHVHVVAGDRLLAFQSEQLVDAVADGGELTTKKPGRAL